MKKVPRSLAGPLCVSVHSVSTNRVILYPCACCTYGSRAFYIKTLKKMRFLTATLLWLLLTCVSAALSR